MSKEDSGSRYLGCPDARDRMPEGKSSEVVEGGRMNCPKCGSELPLEEGWDSMVFHCKKCHVIIDADTGEACEIVLLETLYERGHEERVK